MALGGITNTVDTLHNRVHRRVITYRTVRTIKVVVYRTRQTDTTIIKLLCKQHSTRQRTITADDHQSINPLTNKVVVCLLSTLLVVKPFERAVLRIVPP